MCVNAEPLYWVMFDGPPPGPAINHNARMEFPIKRYVPGPHFPEETLTAEERCLIDRLKRHLADNSVHYNRALWLSEDPDVRALWLQPQEVGGRLLLDLVENTILDVVGQWAVFPVNRGFESIARGTFTREGSDDDVTGDFIEQLLTLPTRGVFAEAKLGHCNASEIIDDTRFWDWQKSPIPDSGARKSQAWMLAPSTRIRRV